MPIKNRFADLHDDITAWRRDIHAHPEILFETHRTSALVAEKLRAFGCDEVVEGIGRTGVVGDRRDLDALLGKRVNRKHVARHIKGTHVRAERVPKVDQCRPINDVDVRYGCAGSVDKLERATYGRASTCDGCAVAGIGRRKKGPHRGAADHSGKGGGRNNSKTLS